MNHSVNNAHAAAVYAALTGHDRGEQGGGAKPTDHPGPGAVLAKLRTTADECGNDAEARDLLQQLQVGVSQTLESLKTLAAKDAEKRFATRA